MKKILALCLIVTSTWLSAADNTAGAPNNAAVVKGEVLEVQDVENYTYLRLQTKDGETWAAVRKTALKKGDKVTIENVTVMSNFESKTLKRTFPTILFGALSGTAGGAGPTSGFSAMHAAPQPSVDLENIKVAKANGANARTVAEVVTKSAELQEKTVLVRGKVVKYTAEIMGKNWIHLRDGSGSAANGSNDILVTSTDQTKAGDVVTAKGIVRTNKDFGAGYAYKVLIEEAKLQP